MTAAPQSLATAHEALLSDRAAGIKQSAVRDVFELSLDPSLVSLAGGNPFLQLLPLEKIGQISQRIVTEQGPEALQYGSGLGTAELREQIIEVMAAEGITNVNVDDVVVTNGSQSAQDMACKVFCNPGDTVLCEDPTYVGALNTFEAYQVTARPVGTDENGLIPGALRERISELRAAGEHIKFLYTIPNFNNPSGITLAAGRRQEIVDICREEGILILEDNPYGMLRYEGQAAPTLRSLDPENVIYMGSFSKIFAPGLRIGWAAVPTHLFRRFYLAGEAVALCPPTLNQMIISAYLNEHDWKGQIAKYNDLYRSRRDAMLQALDQHLPAEVSYTRPEGGFFIWLTLPQGIDTYGLLQQGVKAGVIFIPGAAFSPSGQADNKLRLAFCSVDEGTIAEGVQRLSGLLASAIEANGR
ncbi:PLP-dependent aminotransferase family protein [Glutamicibacter sp. JL.03c]|uniref:aminotransferase-like domain-containing protein n=1 Tax=Glutamicibacter sp. JL.03c TaxID=2984842 RepID=UPI0021F729B9|nr:PLP-dependent aminotransferase family protein [Glutamicibacter sp. JL.03c]UYQ77036.1 PLP-dependent aminotransferase family protein [Glutamicibacter sp. JL.03c]